MMSLSRCSISFRITAAKSGKHDNGSRVMRGSPTAKCLFTRQSASPITG